MTRLASDEGLRWSQPCGRPALSGGGSRVAGGGGTLDRPLAIAWPASQWAQRLVLCTCLQPNALLAWASARLRLVVCWAGAVHGAVG